jgi:SAM-dependent methyltransferase
MNKKADFDKYAGEYEKLHAQNIKSSGFDVSFFDEQKIKVMHQKIGRKFNKPFHFLNFGCGIGKSEKFISQYFNKAQIHSVDVSSESIKAAKERNKNLSGIVYHHFEHISDFRPEQKFDVIFAANVFHHIREDEHLITLQALKTLLKEDGYLFIFEHNPLHPLTQRAFNTCEFDKGCKMIYPWTMKNLLRKSEFKRIGICYTLFFPKFLFFLSPLEPYLGILPLGAQYYALARGEAVKN